MKIKGKYTLQSQVFKIAHILKKTYNLNSFKEALIISWRNFKLKNYLNKGAISFLYLTKEGKIHEAFGTLRNIDHLLQGSDKFKNDLLSFRYYDIEKRNFRTFKMINLLMINF